MSNAAPFGTTEDPYDVIVIGGGVAGLSAGLTLGRSRRSALVIDAGDPRNAPADGVHNFLSRDGMSPLALLEAGRTEVRSYGNEVVRGTVVAARRATGHAFTVDLADGTSVSARRLLVATGLRDECPAVDGLAERWGRDVIHCPYCHGYEVRDQAIGVLASGPHAVHQAMMFRQLSADVTFFANTAPPLTPEQVEQLAARDIRVVDGEVVALEIAGDRITGVRLAGGEVVTREAIAVGPRFVARTAGLEALGLSVVPHAMGEAVGTQIEADPTGRTTVPGVWVAGNATDLMAQVAGAADAGSRAAAMINMDLITEETQRAVEVRRELAAMGAGEGSAR